MLQTRTPTTAEAAYLNWVGQIDCVVCKRFHDLDGTPSEIHHTAGRVAPDCHFSVIALCTPHHRHKDNHTPKRWISRHGDGKAAFESRYASETELITLTREAVDQLKKNHVGEPV